MMEEKRLSVTSQYPKEQKQINLEELYAEWYTSEMFEFSPDYFVE